MKSRTSLVTLLIFSSLQLGCALFDSNSNEAQDLREPVIDVYDASYDETWRALQKAFSRYPIRLNNSDTGELETDIIKPDQMWQPPHKKIKYSPGQRYYIRVLATKGFGPNKKVSTRVSIEKVMTIDRDFFSGSERQASDGLEEKSLHYRVQRELTIERAVKAAYDQGKI